MKRREFLQQSFVLGSLAALPAITYKPAKALALGTEDSASPICPVSITEPSTLDFTGDDTDHPHEVLWARENYLKTKGGIPAASSHAPVVIVGVVGRFNSRS